MAELLHPVAHCLLLQHPQEIAQALRAEGQATEASQNSSQRALRRRRPPVLPMRPGYPPVPPIPRYGPVSGSVGDSNGRHSLDSLAAPGAGSRLAAGSSSSSVMFCDGASGPAATGLGSRSMLLPPPTASTYSLLVDPRYLLHASSYLSAALEQSMVAQAGAGGHLIASTSSAGHQRTSGSGSSAHTRLDTSAHLGPADSGQQLVARARRSLPQSASIAHNMRMPAGLPVQQQKEPG